MKKSFTILTLTIVSIFFINGLLKAGVESNNLTISGKVLYKNTATPVPNAVVTLYFINANQITYKVLESVTVNESGEYVFTTVLTPEDKVRIGAYVNDLTVFDRMNNPPNEMVTDEMQELGAYANDIVMDRVSYLTEIYSKTISVELTSAGTKNVNFFINENKIEGLTDDFGGGIGTYPKTPILHQNFPNPFNPSTSIQFGIPEQSFVSLKVYDMSGKLVADLVNEIKDKGYYTVKFDGSNLASGFYIYRITAGDFSSIKKMSLIK